MATTIAEVTGTTVPNVCGVADTALPEASLDPADVAVIAVYFIFILAVGLWVSHRKGLFSLLILNESNTLATSRKYTKQASRTRTRGIEIDRGKEVESALFNSKSKLIFHFNIFETP